MGKYVPPDEEGRTSGNALHKKHPLGKRASKLASQGILTVRFEMPFPIWCSSCAKPTIIGQGVRFNAEKKKVGMYYTTPIWSFRFRHVACGGWIEMRTDPKNTAYVVVEGAKKRDTGEDKPGEDGDGGQIQNGALVIMTDAEREALRKNAFASLEKTIEDRERLKAATERIDDLMDVSNKHWDDPYSQNQKLRKAFRADRKEREGEAAKTEALRDRLGLGIELVPGTEEDARRAALMDFGADDDGGGDKAMAKPLFNNSSSSKRSASKSQSQSQLSKNAGGKPNLKSEREANRRKEAFVTTVVSNTRVARDPFLQRKEGKPPGTTRLAGVKRKHAPPTSASTTDEKPQSAKEELPVGEATARIGARDANAAAPKPALKALVAYDSDSE